MLGRIASPSLARQTHDVLLGAIRRGEFADGKLPPENELATTLGVSRTTIRTALQRLEHDGILLRRRGIGTRVVMPDDDRFQLQLGRLTALDDLLREHGHDSTTEILNIRREALPTLSEQAGLDPDSNWHVIEKIWYADDHPAALLRDHIPCEIVPELPSKHELLGTIFRLFDEAGPESIAYARVEIVPMLADAAIARQMQIARRAAYLRLWQRHYSVSDRPLAISCLDVNDKFIRFELMRRL
jgi:GntR family transcriptional regulator